MKTNDRLAMGKQWKSDEHSLVASSVLSYHGLDACDCFADGLLRGCSFYSARIVSTWKKSPIIYFNFLLMVQVQNSSAIMQERFSPFCASDLLGLCRKP